MARELLCDVCKKPTDEIVGKLFFAPTTRANGAKSFHNNYQFHLDVGVCCQGRLLKSFNWRKRMSAALYNKSRHKRAKNHNG